MASYVSGNILPGEALPEVIRAVHAALNAAGLPTAVEARLEPAVPVKKSVFPDYIVCLEDGKRLLTLKRHLRTAYGMTPAEYRKKWGLPAGYPMVAPNYTATRSRLAKERGLGRKVTVKESAPAAPEVTKLIAQHIPAGVRGRKSGRIERVPGR